MSRTGSARAASSSKAGANAPQRDPTTVISSTTTEERFTGASPAYVLLRTMAPRERGRARDPPRGGQRIPPRGRASGHAALRPRAREGGRHQRAQPPRAQDEDALV